MKNLTVKLLLLVSIFGLIQSSPTNAYFTNTKTENGVTLTAGCWSSPTVPELLYPPNNYIANPGSTWAHNPYMDWTDSQACPDLTVSYQYECYHNKELTDLAYRSVLLSDSKIFASGTPDGTYYWRVRAYDGSSWSNWSQVWLITVSNSEIDYSIPNKSNFKSIISPTPEIILSPTPSVTVEPIVTIKPEITITPEPTVTPDLTVTPITTIIPSPTMTPEPTITTLPPAPIETTEPTPTPTPVATISSDQTSNLDTETNLGQ